MRSRLCCWRATRTSRRSRRALIPVQAVFHTAQPPSCAVADPPRRTAAVQRETNDDPEEAARRRQSSVNRVLTILKAALNCAYRNGKAASDGAWHRVTPFRGVDAARVRYLSDAEAQRLVNACDAEFRPMVRAALLTGCRYGELSAARVDDFNPDAGTLTIRPSKSGRRHVVLTDEGWAFFKAAVAGKTGDALLLPRPDGGMGEIASAASGLRGV